MIRHFVKEHKGGGHGQKQYVGQERRLVEVTERKAVENVKKF